MSIPIQEIQKKFPAISIFLAISNILYFNDRPFWDWSFFLICLINMIVYTQSLLKVTRLEVNLKIYLVKVKQCTKKTKTSCQITTLIIKETECIQHSINMLMIFNIIIWSVIDTFIIPPNCACKIVISWKTHYKRYIKKSPSFDGLYLVYYIQYHISCNKNPIYSLGTYTNQVDEGGGLWYVHNAYCVKLSTKGEWIK